jgi:hypothetical protein
MKGEINLGNKIYKEKNIFIFDQSGETLDFKVSSNFKGLILNGETLMNL